MPGKKFVFWLAIVLFLACLAEAGSWIFFKFYGLRRLTYHLKVDDAEFARSLINGDKYISSDPYLGWDAPGARVVTGERPGVTRITPYDSGVVKISAYGDSFTACDNKDDETWEFYLSQLTDTKVLNYGTRGFGTDQALFKLERNLRRGWATPIVILGVLSENIARVVNVSPKYYWVETEGPLKPILLKKNGKWAWHTDHLEKLDTKDGRRAAFEFIKKHDYWYEYNKSRPEAGFPYSVSVMDTARYFLFSAKRWWDLWGEARPAEIMRVLIDRFYALSEEYGFTPVVLFIPEIHGLKMKQEGKPPVYAKFLARLEADYAGKGLVIADVFDEDFDPAKFSQAPFSGHASPYGDRAIANAVYGRIKDLAALRGGRLSLQAEPVEDVDKVGDL